MKQAFGLCPSLDMVVPALVEGGIQLMQLRCTLTPGVPVRCMLAKVCANYPTSLALHAPVEAEARFCRFIEFLCFVCVLNVGHCFN